MQDIIVGIGTASLIGCIVFLIDGKAMFVQRK